MRDIVYSDHTIRVKPKCTLIYQTDFRIIKPVIVKDLSINGVTGDSDRIQSECYVTVKLCNDGLSTVVIKKGTPLAEIAFAEEVCVNYES